MQRALYFFLLLSLMISSGYCEVEEETTEAVTDEPSKCEFNEDLVDGNCVDRCYSRKLCGDNTTCSSNGLTTYCYCKKGFTGNPLNGCWKVDEKSPCEPNLCGPNAECIAADEEIGPHCKCKKGFYDWPPNCREGCKNHEDCGPTEFCNRTNLCENVCLPTTCGANSVCRVDKKKKSINCSCKEGYVPETSVGCRLKTPKDSEIPIDFFSSILDDKCDDQCGVNAYCGSDNACVCTQGYQGNATHQCMLIENDRTDPCNPNPCGGYSKCKVDNNEAQCSCIRGYGTPPYCSKCYSNTGCSSSDICVGGTCIFNVCKPFCGQVAGCKIFDGKLECTCDLQAQNEHSQPFNSCPSIQFISVATIAALAG